MDIKKFVKTKKAELFNQSVKILFSKLGFEDIKSYGTYVYRIMSMREGASPVLIANDSYDSMEVNGKIIKQFVPYNCIWGLIVSDKEIEELSDKKSIMLSEQEISMLKELKV